MSDNNIFKNKILLVTTDTSVSRYLCGISSLEDCCVKTASAILHGLNILKYEDIDLCLCDITLEDGTGYTFCHTVKEFYNIPVVFLSSTSDEQAVVSAFDCGADDFITIPFREKEFISRINRLIQRSAAEEGILKFKDIRVDTVKGIVTKQNREIFLSALEYRMLLYFLSNRGKILSRQALLGNIWDMDGHYINDNTLTVYIKRIREKLEDNPSSPQIIKTVRGKGYITGD